MAKYETFFNVDGDYGHLGGMRPYRTIEEAKELLGRKLVHKTKDNCSFTVCNVSYGEDGEVLFNGCFSAKELLENWIDYHSARGGHYLGVQNVTSYFLAEAIAEAIA